jgi:DNA-binding response OmpR family regulator
MRVLLIEDEPEMARLVGTSVTRAGYVVDTAGTIDEAEAAIGLARYSLVLLDRRLPDGDGLALLPRIRTRQPGVPVIVLTALDAVPDRVRGLDAGADDYIGKPYEADELLARVRAALRRPGGEAAPPIVCGALAFDPTTHEVTVQDAPVALPRRELALLGTLMRRLGRVVLRETLLDEVYGFDGEVSSNTLDAHVSRLRARLARAGAGVALHPLRGVGYMLDRS